MTCKIHWSSDILYLLVQSWRYLSSLAALYGFSCTTGNYANINTSVNWLKHCLCDVLMFQAVSLLKWESCKAAIIIYWEITTWQFPSSLLLHQLSLSPKLKLGNIHSKTLTATLWAVSVTFKLVFTPAASVTTAVCFCSFNVEPSTYFIIPTPLTNHWDKAHLLVISSGIHAVTAL